MSYERAISRSAPSTMSLKLTIIISSREATAEHAVSSAYMKGLRLNRPFVCHRRGEGGLTVELPRWMLLGHIYLGVENLN